MIKKTLYVTLVLLAVYASFVKIKPKPQVPQHQWQENFINAQNFIYEDNKPWGSIIVGTSLSGRLVIDSLNGFTNLSFSAQSILDGINIINKSGKFPKRLFIETNLIQAGKNNDFDNSLFNPILFESRKIAPFLRDNRQPLAIIGFHTSTTIRKVIDKFKPTRKETMPTSTVKISPVQVSPANSMFDMMLNNQRNVFSQVMQPKQLDSYFKNLKLEIDKIKKAGTEIIFFEMPVNPALWNLKRAVVYRQKFHEYFPIGQYNYIPSMDCKFIKTTDGIHLGPEEALSYTMHFKHYSLQQ